MPNIDQALRAARRGGRLPARFELGGIRTISVHPALEAGRLDTDDWVPEESFVAKRFMGIVDPL